jgi:hypothetical protein
VAEKKPRGSASLLVHARRRYGVAVDLNELSADQLTRIEADRRACLEELARKGLQTRRLNKVARLRAEADELAARLRAEADELDALASMGVSA